MSACVTSNLAMGIPAFASSVSLVTPGVRVFQGQSLSTLSYETAPLKPRAPASASKRDVTRALFSFFKNAGNPTAKGVQVKPYKFDIGFAFLAHPRKETGEDAFFVQGNSIGVFDGVSTVADALNVDPRLYSQTLAALTSDKVKEYGAASVARAVIEASEENDQIGASTACVVGMEGPRLFGLNLGDSGVLVVRNGEKIFATKPQSHFFNCPYQLTSMSDAGYNSGDTMQMGQNVQLKVREGDLVLLATDGLWDNVRVADIVAQCTACPDPRDLADSLADIAMANQANPKYCSPFQMAAEKAGQDWEGGKEDDLTVVVGKVVNDPTLASVTLLSTLGA